MPVPTVITDLSATAASNYPAGTEAPNVIDDTLRAHASFIRQLYDGPLTPALGSAGAPAYGFVGDTNTGAFSPGADIWGVATGGSERTRVNSSGQQVWGKTLADFSTVGVEISPLGGISLIRNSASNGVQINKKSNAGDMCAFYYDDSTVVGTISNTSTATAYNTSSDVRLKKNITPAPDAGGDIDAIRVVSHEWKNDGAPVKFGVIAQELAEVAPLAVTKGDVWSVDYSKLVPMLIKEVQSLRARVKELE